MKKCVTLTIGQTTIKKEPDYDADTSYLGEYGGKLKPGCYIRSHKKFYEDITDDDDIPNYYNRNEFNFFYPPDNGEKFGTPDYKKYALQDYQVMEDLNNSQWSYCSIVICTTIKTDMGISDKIYSSLCGIEDHWDKDSDDYIKTVIEELKDEQKDQLLKMGFSDKEIEQSFKGAKEVDL